MAKLGTGGTERKRKKEQTSWTWMPAWELVDQDKWDQCHDGSIMRKGDAMPTCVDGECYCGWTEAWENRVEIK